MWSLILRLFSFAVPSLIKSLAGKMLTSGLTAFRKNSFPVLMLAAMLFGASISWYVSSQLASIALSRSKEQALIARLAQKKQAMIAQREAIRRALKDVNEQNALNDEITTNLMNDLIKISRSKPATVEVIKYVQKDDPVICNVPSGSLLQLNYALTGDRRFLSEISATTDASATAPSTVTRRDEYAAHAQCAIRYRETAAQLTRLQQWNQKTYEKYKNYRCVETLASE